MAAMRVIVATTSAGKLAEFRDGLAALGWTLEDLSGRPGLRMPAEDGVSFEENAHLKAATIAHATGLPTLADDSGLEVDALGGEPGVRSARFGNRKTDLERNLLLLDRLSAVRAPRLARFVSVIALAYPDGHLETYRGEAVGEILEGPRGAGGFGYDPLFLVPALGRTYAELSVPEKRAVSHRGRAIELLLEAHRDGPPARQTSRLE